MSGYRTELTAAALQLQQSLNTTVAPGTWPIIATGQYQRMSFHVIWEDSATHTAAAGTIQLNISNDGGNTFAAVSGKTVTLAATTGSGVITIAEPYEYLTFSYTRTSGNGLASIYYAGQL